MPEAGRNMNEALEGRIALVTGGSRGIGRAAALALAKAGVDVAVNFQHRQDEAEAVCAPAAANSVAISRPMPRLPPVTTTTFPENSPGMDVPLTVRF